MTGAVTRDGRAAPSIGVSDAAVTGSWASR